MPSSQNQVLRLAARYRSTYRLWRIPVFMFSGLAILLLDGKLVDGDGLPMLPALGAWILAIGWIWGSSWLALAVAAAVAGLLCGFGPPASFGWPIIPVFAIAGHFLRRKWSLSHPVWSGRSVATAAMVAGVAAWLSALPYAVKTVWHFGLYALDEPMLWLRVLVVPPMAAWAWIYCLAPLFLLLDPKVVFSGKSGRWGWPERPMDSLGMLGIALAVAGALALSPPVQQWPWALVAAMIMVLVGALAFNLVGGAVCALAGCLASSMMGGLEVATEVTVTTTHLSHGPLVIIGLAAGGFASYARSRQDDWQQNVFRYRSLLDSMPIGLVEMDERGLITQANPTAGKIVGCDPVDMLGHPLDRLATEDTGAALASTTRAIRYRRQPEARFVTRFLYRPDHSARDVQVDWVYQRHVKRRGPLRVTALLTDITERQRAIRALREREHLLAERSNLLRITMDALDQGLAVFSPENTLAEWNARFPDMLRLPSPLSRRGTPAIAVFRFLATLGAYGVGVSEAQVERRMTLLLSEPFQDDVQWIGKRQLRFTSHTMPDGGWVWRIEDRTEDLLHHEVEQNRQKMEALGQLASGVAHELNNTLQPIFSLSELGASQVEESSILARCFTRITDAAERAEGIVRGVLTFARDVPAAAEDYPVISTLYDAVAFVEAGLPPQIHLDVTVDEAIPVEAQAHFDRREFGQVLTNLITNAADAMDHKGTIQVRCFSDILRYHARDERGDPVEESSPAVAISVIDTGSGMDYATQQRIFEPFFTTKSEGDGTGLGLAVAFGIVRNWGGRIDVQSEPGFGSSFTIWVPLLVEDRRQAAGLTF